MNENAIRIFDAVGGIGDDLVADAGEVYAENANVNAPVREKARLGWIRWAALAACVCLVLTGALHTLLRLDYFSAACAGASPGYIVDGVHYYSVRHDGVYAYSPEDGTNKRIIGKYFYDDWGVDGYGLYYRRGRSIYVIPHETGRSEKLYTDTAQNVTHIRFAVSDEGVVVTEYNHDADPISRAELLLDGRTGEVIKTLTEMSPTRVPGYTATHFSAGERQLELDAVELDGIGTLFDLRCDGSALLPDGCYCSQYPTRLGDALLFELWRSRENGNGGWDSYIVCRPDGDTFVTLPEGAYGMTGNGDYCFFSAPDGDRTYSVLCLDTRTGEIWTVSSAADDDTYELLSDGEYLYSGAPWSDELACYRVVYENDRPAALELVSGNIAE